ncbi:MAG: hypothetical protein PUF77_01305 [Clostridiales bacterium]|nr:hypothetical protein [Clostridiales bacterium]
MKKKIITVILCIAALALFLSPYLINKYRRTHISSYSSEVNKDEYVLSIELLNKEVSATYDLKAGTSIFIMADIYGGDLTVRIEDSKGEELFSGSGGAIGQAIFTVPSDDTYEIFVSGKEAEADVSILFLSE